MPDNYQPARKHPHPHRTKLLLFVAVLALLAVWGIATRIYADVHLKRATQSQAVPTVAVMEVKPGPADQEIVLPGNVDAWHDATIYARTSGYLKDWKTDIGAHVKQGDLLAEIDAPDLDAQYRQAQANLATAIANNDLAQLTAKRWVELVKTDSVSQQDADTKVATAAADAAIVSSSQASVDNLEAMESFKSVVAPFDGIVTARTTDTGALINAGNGGAGQELFEMAETDKLRVYVQVPESYASAIQPGLTADVHFAEHPTESYVATLAKTADAIDPTSRTLLIQLELDNPTGELMPGSYAEIHIRIPSDSDHIHLPVNTLLFRSEGLQAAVIDDGKAMLKPITIGRDYGKEVEVTSGISPGDKVIINPPDSLMNGQKVKIAPPPKQNDAKSQDEEK